MYYSTLKVMRTPIDSKMKDLVEKKAFPHFKLFQTPIANKYSKRKSMNFCLRCFNSPFLLHFYC